MKHMTIFLVLFSMMLINSCASTLVAPVKWALEEEGVILHLYADKNLNNESGVAKPLNFIVYQLKNQTSFKKRVDNKKELYSMLKCKKFDSSVVSVKKMKVIPGSEVTYSLDRAEGASHVAVVAGYDAMDKKRVTRIYEVPVFVKKETLFSSKSKLVPGQLDIEIRLGADGIEKKVVQYLKQEEVNSH